MTVLLADPAADPSALPTAAIAWAVPRRVGSAVVRNRVRRRLRALIADAHRVMPLPAGAYVFHVDPPAAELSFTSLSVAVDELLSGVRPDVTS